MLARRSSRVEIPFRSNLLSFFECLTREGVVRGSSSGLLYINSSKSSHVERDRSFPIIRSHSRAIVSFWIRGHPLEKKKKKLPLLKGKKKKKGKTILRTKMSKLFFSLSGNVVFFTSFYFSHSRPLRASFSSSKLGDTAADRAKNIRIFNSLLWRRNV